MFGAELAQDHIALGDSTSEDAVFAKITLAKMQSCFAGLAAGRKENPVEANKSNSIDHINRLQEETVAVATRDVELAKRVEEERLVHVQIEIEEVEKARNCLVQQLEQNTSDLQRLEVELKRSKLELEFVREEQTV